MINWKLRFQNKTTLTAIVLAVLALIYQILGLFGVVPAVSQSVAVDIAAAVINLLVLLGIVVDPTTAGIADSERAMQYTRPNGDRTPAEDTGDEEPDGEFEIPGEDEDWSDG